MNRICLCTTEQRGRILEIINAAAQIYSRVIPGDCWREPYMSSAELEREISSGLVFWGYNEGPALVGVMGVQAVRDVELIRHAYVSPEWQRLGIGSLLLQHIRSSKGAARTLVGTWTAAQWAIRFYQRHGFELTSPQVTRELLKTYWAIPERQMNASVVLVDASNGSETATRKSREERTEH